MSKRYQHRSLADAAAAAGTAFGAEADNNLDQALRPQRGFLLVGLGILATLGLYLIFLAR